MKVVVILDASGSCQTIYKGFVGFCESLVKDGFTGYVGNASDVFKAGELGFDGLRALAPVYFCQGREEQIAKIAADFPNYVAIYLTDDAGESMFRSTIATQATFNICVVNVESQTVQCQISGPIDQQLLIESLMKAMPCPVLL